MNRYLFQTFLVSTIILTLILTACATSIQKTLLSDNTCRFDQAMNEISVA